MRGCNKNRSCTFSSSPDASQTPPAPSARHELTQRKVFAASGKRFAVWLLPFHDFLHRCNRGVCGQRLMKSTHPNVTGHSALRASAAIFTPSLSPIEGDSAARNKAAARESKLLDHVCCMADTNVALAAVM